MSQKIELSADTVLVKLHGGVTGITRTATQPEVTKAGAAVETTREVTTRQADAKEAEHAKKLLNQLRATVDKHCTTALGLVLTSAGQLATMRAEIGPIQAEIDTHNETAKFHFIDRSLICAPIALKADPAALTEVCRQIADEMKTARAFFDPEGAPWASPGGINQLAVWQRPVDNWISRTRGLEKLFPTITGQMIGEALTSVKDLRKKVGDLTRANEKAGQSPESALRGAIITVAGVPGSLGLIDNAIGFTVVTDSDAKEANDAARAEGSTVGVH